MDNFARMDNWQATPLQPEVLRVVRGAREDAFETHRYYAKHRDRLA